MNVREARCPRCGYDQRGVVSTWADSCPLAGMCSECGLEFTWDELLRPDRLTPKWCVEYASRARSLPLASFLTFVRSCWPWWFWHRMKMAFAIRWWRLVIYMVTLVTPLFLTYAGAQSYAAIVVLHSYQQLLATWQRQATPNMAAWTNGPNPIRSRLRGPTLPSMRIADNIHREQQRRMIVAQATFALANPPVIDYSPWRAALEATFAPLAATCSGTILSVDSTSLGATPQIVADPYPAAPVEMWRVFFDPPGSVTGTYRRGLLEESAAGLAAVGAWCVLLLAPFPVSLALLPVTRRRAKVRWAHIARVFIYSLAIPIVLIEVIVASWMITAFLWPATTFDEETLSIPVAFAMPLLTMCWWHAAIRGYLRLPHALAVTLVMSILSVMLMAGAIFWIGNALWG